MLKKAAGPVVGDGTSTDLLMYAFLSRPLLMPWATAVAISAVACSSSTDPDDGGAPTDPPPVAEVVSEDVSFPGPDFSREGTLLLPAEAASEVVPGIVLMHGSGPNSRNEPVAGQLNMTFGFTIEVFVELAEAFGDAGYAVLRYDKRT